MDIEKEGRDDKNPGRNSQARCFHSMAKPDARLLEGIVIKRMQMWTWPVPGLTFFEKSQVKNRCNKLTWIELGSQADPDILNFKFYSFADFSLAWLLISSWVLCHLFRLLHEYRAVLLLKLQNYNCMTKIRPAICLNLESAYHPGQPKIKIPGVITIVVMISIAHVCQSA